jgi:hypothetical protein
MRHLLLVGALGALGVAAGCTWSTAVRGQQGKAFVVKNSLFGSTIWNCDATGGKPKCFKVIKQENKK